MENLTLIAINNGKEIRSACALSITHQQIHFEYKGKFRTITYKQTKKGHYILINGIRYYFKVYSNLENKWVIDCDCF